MFVLGQAQESLDSLVEAAKDLAQEVRGPCSLYPNQETGRVGCLEGEVTGQPQAPILSRFWGALGQKERERVLLAESPAQVKAWWWDHVEGKPARALW